MSSTLSFAKVGPPVIFVDGGAWRYRSHHRAVAEEQGSRPMLLVMVAWGETLILLVNSHTSTTLSMEIKVSSVCTGWPNALGIDGQSSRDI